MNNIRHPHHGNQEAAAGPAHPVPSLQPEIFTSIGGSIHRIRQDGVDIGAAWQQYCLDSWHNVSKRVVSVAERPPGYVGVDWQPTQDRPSIAGIFDRMATAASDQIIFLNADVALLPTFKETLAALDRSAIYYGRRLELEPDPDSCNQLVSNGFYPWGYDCFIFPRDFIRQITSANLIPKLFRIGEPWWDYVVPMAAIALGYKVRTLPEDRPLIAHLQHETRYDHECWTTNGQRFLAFLSKLKEDCELQNQGIISNILDTSSDKEHRLVKVCEKVVRTLTV